VEDKIFTNQAWEERTDRDLYVAGRHSPAYYDHATRWMVNEVNLHKARLSGSGNYLKKAKMLVNASRGRFGMVRTRSDRQGPQTEN
jgi:hypothetical protein